MASVVGALGALGNVLGIGSQTDPNMLQRLNAYADPVAAAQNQEALAQQSALAALAQNRQQGITDPQQNLSTLAQYLPQYTQAAAQTQAQNPLAALLHTPQGNSYNPAVSGPKDPNAPASLPWSTQNQGNAQPLAGLTGDDFIKALPPALASQVKGYAEGKIQPSPYLMRTPAGQQMMGLVSQYDPTFDATNYQARAATRKSFTSGPDANNITALNTAMGHAASLMDAYDKLGNTSYPLYNEAKNFIGNAVGNTDTQTATADVASKAHALSGELAKVFRSTGMAEADIKAWEDKISTSATPAQSKALLNSAVDLMKSRLDALGEKYNQGMGTTKQGIELLSPKAQAAYYKITGETPQVTKASGTMDAPTAMTTDASSDDPVAKAKAAGYSDTEIQAYLAKKGKK